MGLFKSSEVKAAREALDDQYDRESKALKAGDPAAIRRNLDLQRKLVETERRDRRCKAR